MPGRDERNSLVNRHLPVQLLGHRRPHDLPGVQPLVHSSEDELPPVVVGGVAAKTVGLGRHKAIQKAAMRTGQRDKFPREQRGDNRRDTQTHVGPAGGFYREK